MPSINMFPTNANPSIFYLVTKLHYMYTVCKTEVLNDNCTPQIYTKYEIVNAAICYNHKAAGQPNSNYGIHTVYTYVHVTTNNGQILKVLIPTLFPQVKFS